MKGMPVCVCVGLNVYLFLEEIDNELLIERPK